MSIIGSDSDFRDAFLEGAARAMFVLAYADFVEEGYSKDNGLDDTERETRRDMPKPGPGGDWYDHAPDTPPNAYALAGEMWAELQAANGEAGVYSLVLRAEAADGVAPDPEEFGRDLAMQYMGTGVSWFDDHAKFEIKIPHAEISSFSFSESAYRGK